MDRKTLAKEEFRGFVGNLMQQYPVSAVVQKGKHHVYADLESPEQLCLDSTCLRTILPPKKYCFPQREDLLRFSTADDVTTRDALEVCMRVVIGLHPCDLHALQMLDTSLGSDRPDDHWVRRRASLVIIGIDCLPDEHCFCGSMRTNLPPQNGYDLFLTDVGESYVVEVGTERGAELLENAPQTRAATAGELGQVLAFRDKKVRSFQLELTTQPENLPLALTSFRNSPVWEEQASKCLACGSCNVTCATCYCFDVLDRMNLSLKEGVRERQWDGCLLPDFAKVAHGGNFRSKGVARYRHRFYRKFEYLPVRYGKVFCCGCGRCSVNCVPDIANPVKVLNKVIDGAVNGRRTS